MRSDGGWGPVWLRPGRRYELVLVRAGARDHRFFYEPFVRSDDLVRLLTSAPGEGRTSSSSAATATQAWS